MKFIWTQYKEVDEFIKEVKEDLLFNKYQNSVILKILDKLKGKIVGDDIRLVTVKESDKNIMIGCQTLPYQMLYFFVNNVYNEEALIFYIDNLIKNNWDINQILGDEVTSNKFAEMYCKKTQKTFKNKENLIVYRLDELSQVNKLPQGKFRTANKEDMFFIPFWASAFNIECKLEEIASGVPFQYEKIQPRIDKYFIWETSDFSKINSFEIYSKPVPVAMANIAEVSDGCACISMVYTPPFYRGEGFATAVVWNVCNDFKRKYKDIMLFADADNPISNRCYQKIGFKKLFINSIYAFFKEEN